MTTVYDNLPTVTITQEEWDALPEYSLSMPTGFAHGKTWKKQHNDGKWTIWHYVEEDGKQYVETGIPQIVAND